MAKFDASEEDRDRLFLGRGTEYLRATVRQATDTFGRAPLSVERLHTVRTGKTAAHLAFPETLHAHFSKHCAVCTFWPQPTLQPVLQPCHRSAFPTSQGQNPRVTVSCHCLEELLLGLCFPNIIYIEGLEEGSFQSSHRKNTFLLPLQRL